jgi:hypothetical protein
VRTGERVIEKSADLIGGFGRKYVLELARLLLAFGFTVHGQRVGEEALCQPVATDDIGRALMSPRSQFNDH